MTGKPGLDKLILLLNAVIVLGSAGAVVYSHTQLKKPPTDQSAQEAKLKENAQMLSSISPVQFKSLVINLYSRKTRLRFIEIELNLSPYKENYKSLLVEATPVINDIVIRETSNLPPKELISVTGKILLANRLKNSINESFDAKIIKKVLFSKYVIQ